MYKNENDYIRRDTKFSNSTLILEQYSFVLGGRDVSNWYTIITKRYGVVSLLNVINFSNVFIGREFRDASIERKLL